MTLLLWLLMGIIGGVVARRVIPHMSAHNAAFSIVVAIIGAIAGGFVAALLGFSGSVISNLVIAFLGSMVVLFFYREYLSDAVS